MEQQTVETPTTTPWEIREAIRREIGLFIDAQGLDGTPFEGISTDWSHYAQQARTLRDLAAAFESVDRIAFNAQQAMVAAPPFDVESLAIQLWNASQEAGASTEAGDAVVAELRRACGR